MTITNHLLEIWSPNILSSSNQENYHNYLAGMSILNISDFYIAPVFTINSNFYTFFIILSLYSSKPTFSWGCFPFTMKFLGMGGYTVIQWYRSHTKCNF